MKRIALLICLLVSACGEPSAASRDDQVIDDPGPGDDAASDDNDNEQPADLCGNGVRDGDELCDGPPVVCTQLAAVWASGEAPCRADCTGYDVADCVRSAQGTESVRPAERDARWGEARCNDGTTFQMEVAMADPPSSVWVIYLEGGGRCDGVIQSCRGRPARLVSSSGEPSDRAPLQRVRDGTLFSRDPLVNPEFHAANLAVGNYCSSDLWSGTNTTPQPIQWSKEGGSTAWVFAGHYNVQAMFEVLLTAYGLDDATSEVLFAGGSAGAAGAQLNIDQLASRLPTAVTEARVAMLANAAFGGEFDYPGYSYGGLGLPDAQVFDAIAGIYGTALDPKCLALADARGLGLGGCTPGALSYLATTAAPPVGWGVRTLIAKNRLDQGPMDDYLIPIVAECTETDLGARAAWLESVDEALVNVPWLYAPADPQETEEDTNLHGLLDPLVWAYTPPGFGGATLRDLVSAFWHARLPSARTYRMVFEGPVPHGQSPD